MRGSIDLGLCVIVWKCWHADVTASAGGYSRLFPGHKAPSFSPASHPAAASASGGLPKAGPLEPVFHLHPDARHGRGRLAYRSDQAVRHRRLVESHAPQTERNRDSIPPCNPGLQFSKEGEPAVRIYVGTEDADLFVCQEWQIPEDLEEEIASSGDLAHSGDAERRSQDKQTNLRHNP